MTGLRRVGLIIWGVIKITSSDRLEVLAEARSMAKSKITDRSRRQKALRAIAEDDTILELMRSGRMDEAREKALSWISSSSG